MKIYGFLFGIFTLTPLSASSLNVQSTHSSPQEIQSLIKDSQSFSKTSSQEILHALINPFWHEDSQSYQPLRLNAIINGKALINEQWLNVGEHIEGYLIVKIESQSVIVQKAKTQFSLAIGEKIIKGNQ
ncbi:hypothetical protein OQH61_08080 [Helicobacter sp. MIT 21-1697]|uniref:hypothetical protein n=1 Tax=Helicobacter sp. MIT 21-1697 TaxID=2993733 RepID=UPI00224B05DC|nr:hypothetical protein [Helicobacter sp. MIT 21-1697]MCX2717691.1 hypothetical protein [Helicobacter sp. MIT 21-1697]